MIVTNRSIMCYDKWTDISVLASIVGGLVLLYLLAWATFKLIAKKEVGEMPIKSRFIVESISRLLFMYWIYTTVGPILAIIWGVFIVWDGIRSIKQFAR